MLSLSNVSPGPFLAFVYENFAKQCHHYKLQFTMHIWEISNMLFVDCVKTELKNLDDDSDSNNGNFYFRRRFLSCPQDSRRPSSYFWNLAFPNYLWNIFRNFFFSKYQVEVSTQTATGLKKKWHSKTFLQGHVLPFYNSLYSVVDWKLIPLPCDSKPLKTLLLHFHFSLL